MIVNTQTSHLISDDLLQLFKFCLREENISYAFSLFSTMSLPCWACLKQHWITGWEILRGPTVYRSKNRELLFIFVLFDHSLPLVLPNYRKNSVWTRKLVLWIHISFVGQWSSCMWHDFCWHITYSLFSFFFSPKSERDFFHSSHKSWRVAVVSLWPGKSFHHLQLQFSLL